MKEKLTKNFVLKLLSLFCAFFVWLAVVNIANPVKVDTKEVPVEFVNKEILERSNLTYEVVGKKSTVVSYKVKTKDAYRIKASDFRAYADLSEMYDVTGAIPIKVEVLKNDEFLESIPTVRSPEVVKIKTEELQTKRFPLYAKWTGQPAEGYVSGTVSLVPDFVYVKGPMSLVGQINNVGIEFNIPEGTSADISAAAPVVFYDANGNSLDLGETVRALNGDISYTLPILKVKNIPIDFVVTGVVKEGYKHTGIECEVKSVPVAGLKSALASVSSITVQSPELSIEGATGDRVCEIDLASYLDPGVQIAGMEQTKVKVTLKVEPIQERIYTLNTKDIVLNGKSGDYDYSILEATADIKIRGLREDLDSLSTGKMNISADVAGLVPGTHEVKLKLVLDPAYEVKALPVCQVVVTEDGNAAEPDSTEDTNPVESSEESGE